MSRRSGYSAQKRRRELAKQKKKKAKEERKLHRDEKDEDSLVAEYLGLEVESEEETDEDPKMRSRTKRLPADFVLGAG